MAEITQTDIDIALAQRQKVSIRVDIHDTDDEKIGELSGVATALSWNIASDSDIRRTATLSMYVQDRSYLVESHNLIWLNRKLKMYVGLDDESSTTHWYLIGSFLFADNTYSFNATAQEMSMSLIDMMACTTEKRGSQINGYGLTIPAGENVRDALISIITNFTPYHQYSIPEFPDTIPYDLEFGIGIYPYEALSKILSLFPTYEMYYDVEGVFTVGEIPTGIGDDPFLDESVFEKLIIAETKSGSFSKVRNTTEIIGRSLEADYTASACTTSGTTYNLFIADTFAVLEDGSLYGFTPDTTSVSGQKIKIQDTAKISIYLQGATIEDDAPISTGAMTKDIPYCVKYTNNRFYLQGELETHVIVQEVNVEPSPEAKAAYKELMNCREVMWIVNPSSPFAADAIGEIRQVLSDGEYADIYTTQLAYERAAYENWKTTRLQDTVSITMGLIPWIDVNKKILYRSPLVGKLISGSFSINDDGILVVDETLEFNPYFFYVKNGALIYQVNEYNNPYINTTFYINDDGELIMNTTDSVATLLIKGVSFNLESFEMTVDAVMYYPYYPF